MYFKDVPQIYYDFDINGKRVVNVVKDITHNVRFKKEILANITLYDVYDIKHGETPEIIAERIYGNSNYHWVIMLVNERYDYINDFPKATPELEKFITDKYGAGHEYDTHHYVDYNGYIVDSSNVQATPVTNYQYEDDMNESKRRIKLISPDLLNTILKNYKDLL